MKSLVGCTAFAVVLLLGVAQLVLAQSFSCAALFPVSGPLGYARRTGSDRCEGLYEAQVSGGGLDLVSFTRGRIAYNLERDTVLFVRAPASGLSIRGQGVPMGVQYRLDAPLPAESSFRLPLNAVLRPSGIGAADIGLVGIREAAGGAPPTYVPLRAGTTDAGAVGAVSVAVLRSEESLQDIQWRLILSGAPLGPFQPVPGGQGLVVAGQSVAIELPTLDEKAIGALELRYGDLQGGTYSQSIRVAGR